MLHVICDDVPRQLRDVIENNGRTLNKLIAIFFCNINTI